MQKRGNKPAKERTLSRNNAQGGGWKVIEQTNPDFFAYYKASPPALVPARVMS